jgi:hypothetical protein
MRLTANAPNDKVTVSGTLGCTFFSAHLCRLILRLADFGVRCSIILLPEMWPIICFARFVVPSDSLTVKFNFEVKNL